MKLILIIDDDPPIADIYRMHLERGGYAVATAADGETGLAMVRAKHPDGVVVDLTLPQMSGIELMRRFGPAALTEGRSQMGGREFLQNLRAQPQFQQLPVVIFYNSFENNLLQKARVIGATQVLIKGSARPSDILNALKAAFEAPPALEAPVAPETPAAAPNPAKLDREAAAVPSLMPQGEVELTMQSELRAKFLLEMPARLAALRNLFEATTKAEKPEEQVLKFLDFHRAVHAITSYAALTGLENVAQVCSALEALLKELEDHPQYVTPSLQLTVAKTMDLLDSLSKAAPDRQDEQPPSAIVLVVDDDIISRRAMRTALKKVNLRSIAVEKPELAMELGAENDFDLVLSDVNMPGMDGFELCQKFHELSANKHTPFIFVTGRSDFETRSRSTVVGGNDLIAKPFPFMELAIKALTHVLIKQLTTAREAVS